MAYIQSHQELGQHPKTKRLARRLGISVPAAVGHLHFLWWWALDYAQDGDLTDYTAEDIAEAVMWDGEPQALLDGLLECRINGGAGFLERNGDGRLLIHDWYDYAGKLVERRKAAVERVRNWREQRTPSVANADVTHNVPVTYAARVEKSREEKSIQNRPTDGAERAAKPASYPQNVDKSNGKTRELTPFKPKDEADTRRRALFMALLNGCGYDRNKVTKTEQGELNAAVKQLLEAGYEAAQADEMAANWYGHFGDLPCTPSAIVKHASRLLKPKGSKAEADQWAALDAVQKQRDAALAEAAREGVT